MMIRSESIILESAQWLKLLRWAEEVTNSQYTIFLNAVAKTDSFHRLYNTQMQDDLNGGIIRSGAIKMIFNTASSKAWLINR